VRASQIPFPVKLLDITTYRAQLSTYFPFFPSIRSTLKRLHISVDCRYDAADFSTLVSLIVSNLRHLTFSSIDPRPPIFTLSNYSVVTTGHPIPSEAFRSLTRLTSLSLTGFHGPSLRLLDTLTQNSPLLVRVSFTNSRWVADNNRLSTNPDEIFPTAQILAVLQRFSRLKGFFPGILPAEDQITYSGFARVLNARGIATQFELCEKEDED